MKRLTSYKSECKREMICRHEDCDTCEEYCPHINEDNCTCLQEVLEKLAEYEDLEEEGKLLKLLCAVGDTVYVIPSETNYKLNIINGRSENNRVYEQIVKRIEISNTGYLFITCDGMASVVDTFYKKTWFLSRGEAKAALNVMAEKTKRQQAQRRRRNDRTGSN